MPMSLKKTRWQKDGASPRWQSTINDSRMSLLTLHYSQSLSAHLWQRQLKSCKYKTVQRYDANNIQICATDRLNFLAPQLKRSYPFRTPTPPYVADLYAKHPKPLALNRANYLAVKWYSL